ncbi:MAG: hypothetical protein IMZ69_09085 [Spirochaetes bacterium]|nr:hypothetical protein [Spirochaetota bacterium]
MMTEAQIKTLLCAIRKPPRDFEVTLTHRANKRINGTYYMDRALIKINDRNFTRDSVMLFTAIHEYAHHLQYCAREKTSHNREFYALYHDLVDEAIEKKLLEEQPTTDAIQKAETEVKELLRQHVELERRIAAKLIDLHNECALNSVNPEYWTERRLQLPHNGQRPFLKTRDGSEGIEQADYINADAMRVCTKGPAAELALREGKTIVQAQTAAMAPEEELDPYEALKKEKEQIAERIVKLEDRKDRVEGRMRQMELRFTDEEPGRKTG